MALKARGFAPDDATGVHVPSVAAPARRQKKERTTAIAPSRVGLEQLVGYVSPETKRSMRAWGALNGVTMQEIVEDMVEKWCREKGLHRLG